VVVGGVVLGGVVVDDDSPACCPPPPAFSHPAKRPTQDTRHTDTTTQPHRCHPCLCRTYGYLLLCQRMGTQPVVNDFFDER
jgi:hypothetical protein